MFVTSQYDSINEKDKGDLLRVKGLKQRFVALGETFARTKNQRTLKIDERLHSIESSLADHKQDETHKRINNAVDSVCEKIESFPQALIQIEAEERKKMAEAQEDFKAKIEETKREGQALVAEFHKESNDRLFSVSALFNKSQKAFSDRLDQRMNRVIGDLENLTALLENEVSSREEQSVQIESKISDDLVLIEKDIQVESKLRNETHQRLKLLSEEVFAELERLMVHEKQERESVNNSLLSLLEESCYKIEKNFTSFD